jgi:hypothetical protein
MARVDPSGFVRVVANILPDKLEVDVKHQIERIELGTVDRVIEHEQQTINPLVTAGLTPGDVAAGWGLS